MVKQGILYKCVFIALYGQNKYPFLMSKKLSSSSEWEELWVWYLLVKKEKHIDRKLLSIQ